MKKQILLATLAAAFSVRAAEIPPDAKTFALVVGISKYQKLPQDLWLQYPEADAKALSLHLASPRGGGVPADQMLVLTNEQATTATLRSAFQTFLKTRPGANDTVFILIAGHGTVDSSGAFGFDNTDVRYAHVMKLDKQPLILGLDMSGQRDGIAARIMFDRNSSDRPDIGGRRC